MGRLITSDPKILGGKPVIAGTRIPVSLIFRLLKDGYTVEAIHEFYPQLSIKVINNVVDEIIKNTEQKLYAA
jgi:uncharacterized protein (DUF433 family)